MKYTLTAIFIFGLFFTELRAQRNAVYAEALGNGILYSFNFDRRFKDKPDGFGFRLGANLIPSSGNELVTFVPAQLNYIIGNQHALELGAGVVYSYQREANENRNYLFPNAALMYRFQSKRNFLIRAGLAPTFPPKESPDAILPSKIFWFIPGISVGFRF